MERRVRWKLHARCGAGENPEIISKDYLSLFAIEAVQSLFENMLSVPQSELEATVMRFREEVKNLGEPEI